MEPELPVQRRKVQRVWIRARHFHAREGLVDVRVRGRVDLCRDALYEVEFADRGVVRGAVEGVGVVGGGLECADCAGVDLEGCDCGFRFFVFLVFVVFVFYLRGVGLRAVEET